MAHKYETPNRLQLRKFLTTCFNDSELRDLCFTLHIDYEQLGGQNKADKVRELIAYCERHSRADELAQTCFSLRPHLFRTETCTTPIATLSLHASPTVSPIERLVRPGVEYLPEYFAVFLYTLRDPSKRFRPITSEHEIPIVVSTNGRESSFFNTKLSPRLFGFMLISIFIGSTVHLVAVEPSGPPQLINIIVVTLVIWLAYGISLHLACRLLGKHGNIWETLSIMLQVFSVVFVVNNLFVVSWRVLSGAVSSLPAVTNAANMFPIITMLIKSPIFAYPIIHSVLMAIYIPRALKKLYNLNLPSQVVVSTCCILISMGWALFGITIYPYLPPGLDGLMPCDPGC